VFLTGQREVEHLCTRLRRHFAKKTRTALQQEGEQGQQVPAGESGQPEQQEDTALREAGTNGGDGAGGGGGVEDTFGPDRAEAAVTENEGNRLLDAEQEEVGDDYDDMNRSEDEDEEEVVVMGGESLTPQEVAEAEARFEQQLQQSIQGGSGLPGGTQAAGEGCRGVQAAAGHMLLRFSFLTALFLKTVRLSGPAAGNLILLKSCCCR
jgi:ATP-dependent RNA helicase DHX37/DHR1